ncbi:MAG: S8 family serine peptidase [Bacteroidales bacterium]|nr:S8 family serine peptidase [Bacteroidales bacterium]
MKTHLLVILVGILLPYFAFTQTDFHNLHILDPYNPEYVEGEIIVKFKDEAHVQLDVTKGFSQTGIESIDLFLEKYAAQEMGKIFKETREQRNLKSTRYYTRPDGTRKEIPALFNIFKLKVDPIWDAKELAEELKLDKNVDFAEPNFLCYTSEVIQKGYVDTKAESNFELPVGAAAPVMSPTTVPNDPLYLSGDQAYLDAIHAPEAWDIVTGDTTQIIAIIDTGVDWDHPDLDDNIWTNWDEIPDNGIDDDNNGYIDDTRGWDYINNDNDPNDDNSHGTHCAGIAAAEGNNGIGMCGVAWNSRILPVKVLQSTGSGNSTDFAAGIEYAADNGATVISMSLGSYGESMLVKTALENAYAGTGDGEGSILVGAAGNDGYKIDPPFPPFPIYAPMYPGCYSFVLGVEASDNVGELAVFSNMDLTGPVAYTNIFAHNYETRSPGVGILSCKPNGSYWNKSGTSMACPEVAGTVALMRQHQPDQSGEIIFAKLIQGSGSMINIYNSLTLTLQPDLVYVGYTIVDTLPGCDRDGCADAGETIEVFLTVKNAGGQADSVWTKLRFAEFEDETVADISDSTSSIGSMSAYATLSGELDPFIITISNDVVHNRQVKFEYEIGNEETSYTIGELVINVQNGLELGGFYTENLYLHSEYEYYGTQSIVIDTDDTLFIEPGVTIYMDPNKAINVKGAIMALGTQDSLIRFTSESYWGGIIVQKGLMDYTLIENIHGANMAIDLNSVVVTNSLIRNNNGNYLFGNNSSNAIFLRSSIISNYPNVAISLWLQNFHFENCNLNSNYCVSPARKSSLHFNSGDCNNLIDCNVFNNHEYNMRGSGVSSTYVSKIKKVNYYGYVNEDYIENEQVYDFFDDPNIGILNIETYSETPTAESHGIVWKVDVNDALINKIDNPYNANTGLGIVGSETLKFDVYFNRAMDTAYTPLLTFGVREPYTQHIVRDNASWSVDSTVWTAYYTVGLNTGDGVQRVRVHGARDDEKFEIPVEDQRFEFIIQAAGSLSNTFMATAGIGKVDLEWPGANTEDELGYNIYRFYNLTDSTYSDTLRINNELVLDTLYTDFEVIPDSTYHYLYSIIGTDMKESDYSKRVSCTPFSAANGDANGDLSVNVLDITTIVSQMLGQSPEPFLFDAADVNYDNQINVLDIIGLVQLINGNKSTPILPLPAQSNAPAYYTIDGNTIQLESQGNIAGLQFKLKSEDGAELTDKIKLFAKQAGFEFAYVLNGDEINGVLYSMSGKQLPQGTIDLLRVEGGDVNYDHVVEVFGGDPSGNYVPVLRKGAQVSIDKLSLTASPNPFRDQVQIDYTLPEAGKVKLNIYDLSGRKLTNLVDAHQREGNHSSIWISSKNHDLKSGVYLVQLMLETSSREKYSKEVKIVLAK